MSSLLFPVPLILFVACLLRPHFLESSELSDNPIFHNRRKHLNKTASGSSSHGVDLEIIIPPHSINQQSTSPSRSINAAGTPQPPRHHAGLPPFPLPPPPPPSPPPPRLQPPPHLRLGRVAKTMGCSLPQRGHQYQHARAPE